MEDKLTKSDLENACIGSDFSVELSFLLDMNARRKFEMKLAENTKTNPKSFIVMCDLRLRQTSMLVHLWMHRVM